MVEDIAFRVQGETHQLAFHDEEFDLFHGQDRGITKLGSKFGIVTQL